TKTAGADQAQMLQIPLAPAPVALELVENIRRRFFVAARQVGGEPDLETGAPHQRCLDKIVAQDFAAERRLAGKARQAAMAHERRDAQNRVVAPVITLAQLPEVKARAEQRPVNPAGELLHARE